jgi:hypothetical protein
LALPTQQMRLAVGVGASGIDIARTDYGRIG